MFEIIDVTCEGHDFASKTDYVVITYGCKWFSKHMHNLYLPKCPRYLSKVLYRFGM